MSFYLPQELVSTDGISAIERIVEWFPAAITDTFCFELELKEDSFSSDFSFLCRRNETGVDILAGKSEIQLPQELFTNKVWQNVRTFCQAWSEPDSWIREYIMYLWVELDIQLQPRVPAPVIFLGIPHHRCTDVNWLLPIFELLNFSPSTPFLDILRRSFQFAVSETNIFEIAFLFSRNTDMTRLVFHGVNEKIAGLLAELGVSDVTEVKKIMADLIELGSHITVDLDAGESIGPKIGMECQFSGNVRMDRPLWKRGLDYLVSHEYCTPEKRDALLRWPGGSTETLKHLLLPVRAIRKINNYKINWQPDASVQAKAYLLARFF